MEMFSTSLLSLTLKISHCAFKCKESPSLVVGSDLAVRLLKMKAITERGCSMNYRFSPFFFPVFFPFTQKGVTCKTSIVFLCEKKYSHSQFLGTICGTYSVKRNPSIFAIFLFCKSLSFPLGDGCIELLVEQKRNFCLGTIPSFVDERLKRI